MLKQTAAQLGIVEVDHPAPYFLRCLRKRISNFRESSCRTKADPGGQAHRTQDVFADLVRRFYVAQTAWQHRQPEKAFIDRIDFDRIGVLRDHRVEAGCHDA